MPRFLACPSRRFCFTRHLFTRHLFTRHLFTWLLFAGLLASWSPLSANAAPGKDAERPPNILFILADDVGVDAIGCYGGSSYPTPRIDALAKQGLRYEHGFSMPSCHPTRITLLTGRYPFHLGHPKWGTFPKADEQKTVAHLLKKAGYATAIAGKWQLVLMKDEPDHIAKLGFDESCVFGWHEGPRYYEPMIYQNGKVRDDVKDRFGPDVYVEFLVDFMKRNRERPFFAYYSMALCHDVTDDLEAPVPFGPQGHYDTFVEMMQKMDERVGRIVDSVKELGLADNTVIVFTGDNGTAFSYLHTAENGKYIRVPVFSMYHGELIQGGKTKLTNGGTHVPLIVVGPHVQGGVTSDLVDFSDMLPTFAQLAGVPVPADWKVDGQSCARLWGDYEAKPRTWAFAEGSRGRAWVRTQRYKLYTTGEFYDLVEDPKEQTSLTQPSADAAAVQKELQATLDTLGV
ncbi:sulfatase-like hydrolase/transferase [Lignipirellula cremea]|uniref:Arylsulfatase n=1 Tax=Lignipirellula cremea TaxID=2528010 RepID=A0A518DTE3_9BACT|nr:sulfatase-like hydrolase/transferase [Lignipirellula cremea]QDU95109.1 Arylsulfatase [Lignipirellula cremea]